MVRIQDERLAVKPDIYVLSSNRLHVVGDTQLDTDALQAVPKDLSHCIEVPSQLMHVGRCGMPQIVEADMSQPLMTKELAKVRRHPLPAFRATIGLCNYQVIVIVVFTG